jgi:bidirectional [NiFe] hydrogenase diaphorase subunit
MEVMIDGLECSAEHGEYLLQVAEKNNIYIPALCHDEALAGQASCRICIVEVAEGEKRRVVTACVYPIAAEIEVFTDSPRLRSMRRAILTLLLARAPGSERVRELAEKYEVYQSSRFRSDEKEQCILCGLCTAACEKMGTGAIVTVNRGISKKIATPFEEPALSCIGCGACANVCPCSAIELSEEGGKRTIWSKEFELVCCTRCGESVGTREQLKHVNQRLDVGLGNFEEEPLCESCRLEKAAAQMKNRAIRKSIFIYNNSEGGEGIGCGLIDREGF